MKGHELTPSPAGQRCVSALFAAIILCIPAQQSFGQAPPNDDFTNATAVSLFDNSFAQVSGDNENATLEPGEPEIAGNPGGKSVWWYWRAPTTPGAMTISTEGSTSVDGWALQTLLGVYTGNSLLTLNQVATNAGGLYDGGSIVSFDTQPGAVYWVVVDGYTYDTPQDADSGSITLTFEFATNLPPNDNFSNAIQITGTNTIFTGSNANATKEPGEPDIGGNPGGKSVWWYWQAPAAGVVTISDDGSTNDDGGPFDMLLGAFTGDSVSNLTEIATNFDGENSISFRTSTGNIYYIDVDGWNYGPAVYAEDGFIMLSLSFTTNTPPNDDFADAKPIIGTNTVVTGSNVNATKEPGEPDHAGNPGGKSVWWYWRAPQNGFVTISSYGSTSINGGSLDVLLGVYTGSVVSNLAPVTDAYPGQEEINFSAVAGTIYRIAVDGYSYYSPQDADSGPIMLSLNFTTNYPLAPAWSVPNIDGSTLASTNFAGDVIVLNFWATWCGPCVAEIPDLIALQQKYGPDGLQVLGLSVDDSPDGTNPPTQTVGSFASSEGINYPVGMVYPSASSVVDDYGGIYYIPTTFIIDRHNRIRQTFVGEETFSNFEAAVLPLLYPNLAVTLTLNNGFAHISWPMHQATFVVETTQDLSSGIWTVTNLPVQSDSVNEFIDLPLGKSRQFFRLATQPSAAP